MFPRHTTRWHLFSYVVRRYQNHSPSSVTCSSTHDHGTTAELSSFDYRGPWCRQEAVPSPPWRWGPCPSEAPSLDEQPCPAGVPFHRGTCKRRKRERATVQGPPSRCRRLVQYSSQATSKTSNHRRTPPRPRRSRPSEAVPTHPGIQKLSWVAAGRSRATLGQAVVWWISW